MPRRSSAAVAASRADTLAAATDLASRIGLEALTIGDLAERLSMSKSGLIGRFGSKRELQRAVLASAVATFTASVYEPARRAPAGRARLEALCDAWTAYLADPPWPGGCLLTTASVELDARPGPLRDEVRMVMRRWTGVLEREARTAVDRGEFAADADPADIAFTLNALGVGANCDFQLHGNREALARARRAMRLALEAHAPQPAAGDARRA